MKKAIVTGGLVAVTTLATGIAASAAPGAARGHSVTNTGLCVAGGVIERAADPAQSRGPVVLDLDDDGPDRQAQGPFFGGMACSRMHVAH